MKNTFDDAGVAIGLPKQIRLTTADLEATNETASTTAHRPSSRSSPQPDPSVPDDQR